MAESANSQDPEPELLVHITAPTSAKHDAGYREQAKSAVEFEAATRVRIGGISWPRTDIVLGEDGEEHAELNRPAKRRQVDWSTYSGGEANVQAPC